MVKMAEAPVMAVGGANASAGRGTGPAARVRALAPRLLAAGSAAGSVVVTGRPGGERV